MSLDAVAKLTSNFESFNLTPVDENETLLERLVTCPNGSQEFLQALKKLRLFWSEGLKVALAHGCGADYISCQIKDYIRPSVLSAFIEVLEAANDDSVKEILKRFEQLKQVHKTTSIIDVIGLLRLAVFIETKMQPAIESGMRCFYKSETKLPRTLLIDPARAIYVLSQQQEPMMVYYHGTDEVFQKCLAIPLAKAEKVGFVENGITIGYKGMCPNAIEFAQLFKGKRGLAQLLYSYEDASPLANANTKTIEGPRHRAIWELYPHNLTTCRIALYALHTGYIKRDNDLLLSIEDVLCGLSEMHSQKIVHGNINPMNVWLYSKTGNRQMAVLGNFACSFYADKAVPSNVKDGYGTIRCTAPELLGVKNFSGDLYKPDIFALGVSLYSWIVNTDFFSWEGIFEKCNEHGGVTQQLQKEYQDSVRDGVEQMKKSFTDADDWRDKIVLLALKMMHPDPDKRYDVAMCLKELRAI